MSTRPSRTLVLAALVALVVAGPAEAQLGGLIRKKVEEKTRAPEKKDAAVGAQSPYNSDVLEITPPVFEGFLRGLKIEVALTKEFRAELAKYPTAEQRRKCETDWGMSPDAQKLMMSFSPPENATAEQIMALQQKHYKNIEDAMRKKCPLDADQVWPNGKRMERMAEIKTKAAANAGPEGTSGSDPLDEEGADTPVDSSDPIGGPFATFVPAAGLTVLQYDILLERIKRFCDELKANAAAGRGGSGGVKIPGAGTKIFWVYSPTEAQTLSQANCQRVYDLIGQLI